MKRIYASLLLMLAAGSAASLCAEEYISVKASGVAVTAGGRVWAATVGEASEGRTDVVLSRSDDFLNWTGDTLSVDGCLEAVLWAAPGGELVMFCSTSDGYIRTKWCSSPDSDDPQWIEGAEVGRGPWECTSSPVVSDGIWVLPVAFQKGVCTVTSRDKGVSWQMNRSFVKVPDKVSGDNAPLIVPDGQRLMMFMRTTGSTYCYRSLSEDNGATWTATSEFIPNPDRDISFQRLPDGRLLMIKCSRLDHNVHVASLNIIASLSDDNGQTWYGGQIVSKGRKAIDPRTTLGTDGSIYIFYTYDPDGNPQTRICRTTSEEIAEGTVWKEVRARKSTTLCKAGKAVEASRQLTAARTDWADEPLRLATWNIQYLAKKPSWKEFRLPAIYALLNEYEFDVFGSQEPYLPQIEDIMEGVSDKYAWVGECTGDKDSRKTHYNPIFYKKERLELLETGTVPYSETKGTIGYGAMYARACTWAKFMDRETGKIFYFFNSHFDHQGVEAREVSAEILVSTVRRIAAGYPAFMTGDFNSDEDTVPYRIIVDSGFIGDTMNAVQNPENAEYFSMSRYKSMDTVKKSGRHIDHVFYTPNSVKVLSWKLITDNYDGKFGSDHLPIMADVLIAN